MRSLSIAVSVCLLSLAACERSATQNPDNAVGAEGSNPKVEGVQHDGARSGPSGEGDAAEGNTAERKVAEGSDPDATCQVNIVAATETMVGRYPSLDIRVDPPIRHHGGPTPALHVQVISPSGDMREQDYALIGQSTCAYCLPAPGSGGCEHSCTYQEYPGEETSFGRMIKVAGTHQLRFSLRNLECALNVSESKIEVAPKPAKP